MPDEIKDAEGKVIETPESKGFADFSKQFSAKKNAPPEMGGDIDSESNQKVIEQKVKEGEKKEQISDEQKKAGEQVRFESEKAKEKKGPGSNVPEIIAKKKAAEEKVAELETKHQEFQTKIQELEAKIASGDFSAKKEQEFQSKIESMETQMKTEKESLVNENKRLQSRLTFHDIQEDPEFQNQYLKPVISSYNEAEAALGGDEKNIKLLTRALFANSASLKATTKEEKIAAENERDTILSGIVEGLPSFSGQRFAKHASDYIANCEKHANALKDHEKTNLTLREQYKQKRDQEYASQLDTWDKMYNHAASKFTEEESLSDEEKKIADELELKIEDDLKESSRISKGSLNGTATKMDAVELLHKGRLHPVLKAKIAIRDKQIKDLQSLVSKLRGSGTGDAGETEGPGKDKQEKPKTREDFMSQFRASRIK